MTLNARETWRIVVLPFLLGASVASAQPAKVGMAVKVSTSGFGLDVATRMTPKTNVRAGFTYFSLGHDFNDDGIDTSATFNLRTVSAHFDWFPSGGGFHVSPGIVVYNGIGVDGITSVPVGTEFDLGDETLYSGAANPVRGTSGIKFKKVAPSLMLGWGNVIPRGKKKWSIPFELGVMYSRAATATFVLRGTACNASGANCRDISTDLGLQKDLQQEVDDINDDLSAIKLIPVISIGFSYRFGGQ